MARRIQNVGQAVAAAERTGMGAIPAAQSLGRRGNRKGIPECQQEGARFSGGWASERTFWISSASTSGLIV